MKFKNIIIIMNMALLMLVTSVGCLEAQNEKKIETKEQLVEKWNNIFGNEVDFLNKTLFDGMIYIGPQEDKLMKPFGELTISEGILNKNKRWMSNFFQDEYKPDLDSIKPIKYYLPIGAEAANLYYEWESNKYQFSLYDSYNGILLSIKALDSPKGSISNVQMMQILKEVLNVNSESAKRLAENLSNNLKTSGKTTFTNTDKPLVYARGWEDNLVGFLNKEGVNIICLKADGNRAMVGMEYNNEWLGISLYKEDGTLLIENKK